MKKNNKKESVYLQRHHYIGFARHFMTRWSLIAPLIALLWVPGSASAQGLPSERACGDGILGPKEKCDDGNLLNGDGCSEDCVVEEGWVCDADSRCRAKDCGDQKVVGAETCDDGNLDDGDGCSSTCQVEDGWTCAPNGGSCISVKIDDDIHQGLPMGYSKYEIRGTHVGDGDISLVVSLTNNNEIRFGGQTICATPPSGTGHIIYDGPDRWRFECENQTHTDLAAGLYRVVVTKKNSSQGPPFSHSDTSYFGVQAFSVIYPNNESLIPYDVNQQAIVFKGIGVPGVSNGIAHKVNVTQNSNDNPACSKEVLVSDKGLWEISCPMSEEATGKKLKYTFVHTQTDPTQLTENTKPISFTVYKEIPIESPTVNDVPNGNLTRVEDDEIKFKSRIPLDHTLISIIDSNGRTVCWGIATASGSLVNNEYFYTLKSCHVIYEGTYKVRLEGYDPLRRKVFKEAFIRRVGGRTLRLNQPVKSKTYFSNKITIVGTVPDNKKGDINVIVEDVKKQGVVTIACRKEPSDIRWEPDTDYNQFKWVTECVLPTGEYKIDVRMSIGHDVKVAGDYAFSVDYVPPTISIDNVQENDLVRTSQMQLVGNLSTGRNDDKTSIDNVKIEVLRDSTQAVTCDTPVFDSTNWAVNCDTRVSGRYSAVVTVEDSAGNTASANVNFVVHSPDAGSVSDLLVYTPTDQKKFTPTDSILIQGAANPLLSVSLIVTLNKAEQTGPPNVVCETSNIQVNADGTWSHSCGQLDIGSYKLSVASSFLDAPIKIIERNFYVTKGFMLTDLEPPSERIPTPIFENGMVILRGIGLPLTMISAELAGVVKETQCAENGSWSIGFEDVPSGNYTIRITSSATKEEILQDIIVDDLTLSGTCSTTPMPNPGGLLPFIIMLIGYMIQRKRKSAPIIKNAHEVV